MSPFEYVVVLVSIIIGLGITLVLTGIAQLLREEQRVKLFWPYLIWIGLVFVMHIHEWWITYQLKSTLRGGFRHFCS
jgi:MFS superfamily sulfate permease-like transporter